MRKKQIEDLIKSIDGIYCGLTELKEIFKTERNDLEFNWIDALFYIGDGLDKIAQCLEEKNKYEKTRHH